MRRREEPYELPLEYQERDAKESKYVGFFLIFLGPLAFHGGIPTQGGFETHRNIPIGVVLILLGVVTMFSGMNELRRVRSKMAQEKTRGSASRLRAAPSHSR